MSEPRVFGRGGRAVVKRGVRLSSALLALGLCWAAPRVAAACYCVAPELEGSIDSADVIFEGMTAAAPEEIERDIGLGAYGDVQTRRYDFEVLRYFKASGDRALPAELALHTPAQAPACGRTFDPSEVYLIYARVRDDGLLVDFRCSRTRSFDNAGEDLALLGEGTVPEQGTLGSLADLDAEGEAALPSLEPGTSTDLQIGGGCSQARAPGGPLSALALLGLALPAVLRARTRRARSVTR